MTRQEQSRDTGNNGNKTHNRENKKDEEDGPVKKTKGEHMPDLILSSMPPWSTCMYGPNMMTLDCTCTCMLRKKETYITITWHK